MSGPGQSQSGQACKAGRCLVYSPGHALGILCPVPEMLPACQAVSEQQQQQQHCSSPAGAAIVLLLCACACSDEPAGGHRGAAAPHWHSQQRPVCLPWIRAHGLCLVRALSATGVWPMLRMPVLAGWFPTRVTVCRAACRDRRMAAAPDIVATLWKYSVQQPEDAADANAVLGK